MAASSAPGYYAAMDIDTSLPPGHGDGFALPLVLRARRGMALVGTLALILMTIALGGLHASLGGLVSLIGAVVFGVLAALGLLGVLFPPSLTLDAQGFALHGALRRGVKHAWSDIAAIEVRQVGPHQAVVYQLTPAAAGTAMPGGYMLPSSFPMPAAMLGGMMQACREQFASIR